MLKETVEGILKIDLIPAGVRLGLSGGEIDELTRQRTKEILDAVMEVAEKGLLKNPYARAREGMNKITWKAADRARMNKELETKAFLWERGCQGCLDWLKLEVE